MCGGVKTDETPSKNVGDGFDNTLSVLVGSATRYVSGTYLARGYPAEPDHFSTSQLLMPSRLEQS